MLPCTSDTKETRTPITVAMGFAAPAGRRTFARPLDGAGVRWPITVRSGPPEGSRGVQEYSRPANATVDPSENLSDMVWTNAERFGDDVSLRRRSGTDWKSVTSAEFAADVATTAKGLIAAGIQPGDRVVLLSRLQLRVDGVRLRDLVCRRHHGARLPHVVGGADRAGSCRIPAPVAALVDRSERAATVRSAAPNLPSLQHIWTFADGDLDALATSGAQVSDADLLAARRSRGAADVASIVYTSGTTGRPKGCRITHSNLLYMSRTVVELDYLRPGAATLCSFRWRTCSPASSRSAPSTIGPCWRTAATRRRSCRTCRRSGRPTSWPCRGCSRRSTTPRGRRRPARSSRGCSPQPSARRSPGRRHWTRADLGHC